MLRKNVLIMTDDYLENISSEIINGNAKVVAKNYQINNVKLTMNYNIGKELAETGKHYGEGIVKKYAKELTRKFGKGYTFTELTRMYNFYILTQKVGPVAQQLTWSHYVKLLPLKNVEEIKYYINITKRSNLSKRALAERIRSNEYGRLRTETKLKLKEEKNKSIRNGTQYNIIQVATDL